MSDYNRFADIASDMKGYFAASLTDEYLIGRWPEEKKNLEGKEEKLLEIRVFNEDKEVKLFRTDIGKPFSEVSIIDDNYLPEGMESFCQEQFLDIDTEKSDVGSGTVRSTGGGRYNLPIDNINDAKVIIKYYLRSDPESGLARIADWRVAGFKEA